MLLISCFEHQRLLRGQEVPAACFDWLVEQTVANELLAFQLSTKQGKLCLKARQYVGVIATPFGTQVEILPKINQAHATTELATTRQWLTELLNKQYLSHAKTQKNIVSQSKVADQPVHLWLAQQLLNHCEQLLASGVTSHYQSQAENETFLRGKLNVADNIRQNQSRLRQHQFAQTADTRKNDSPENRLLLHALYLLVKTPLYESFLDQSQSQTLYQRLSDAVGLRHTSMVDVVSYQQRQFVLDAQQCQRKRLLPLYQSALPIAELLLSASSNGAGVGQAQGVSLLFNMQTLFETMVADTLEQMLQHDEMLLRQHRGHALLEMVEQQSELSQINTAFNLRPDMVVQDKAKKTVSKVVDAKWKLLNDANITASMSQADVYQMLAYANSYFLDTGEKSNQSRAGELWMVYPQTEQFNQSVEMRFTHMPQVTLMLVPLDVVERRFIL